MANASLPDFQLIPLQPKSFLPKYPAKEYRSLLLLELGQGQLIWGQRRLTLRAPVAVPMSVRGSWDFQSDAEIAGHLLQWRAEFQQRAQYLCPGCELWDVLVSGSTQEHGEIRDLMILELADFEDFGNWIKQIQRDQVAGHQGLILELQFTELILRLDALRSPGEVDPNWLVESVVELLEEGFARDWSLKSLAKELRVPEEYLSRHFSREKGMALFEYLNRVRIRKACQLLKRTDKSILQIAMEVGYNNQSFFGRYFKRIMGMSPREYRK